MASEVKVDFWKILERGGTLWILTGNPEAADRAATLAAERQGPRGYFRKDDGAWGRAESLGICGGCGALGAKVTLKGQSNQEVLPELLRGYLEDLHFCPECRQ